MSGIRKRAVDFVLDWEYIKRRGGINKISKLITFYEGQPQETKNRAFECPFTLTAHPALMKPLTTAASDAITRWDLE